MKHYLLKSMMLLCMLMVGMGAWSTEVTWTASEQGYTNGTQYTSATVNSNISLAFGDGTNDGKYYTTGSGIRIYANGKVTVTASNGCTMTNIAFTFDGTNTGTFSANVGTYSNKTWTGSSNSVVFTNTATSGHARIQKIVVTYSEGRKTITKLFKNNPSVMTPNTAGNMSDYVSIPADYDGTIYYASEDEDVIVFDTDGSFLTGDHGTSTTVYATAAATSKYNAVNLSATVNIERSKTAPTLTFATPSYTFTCFDDDKTTQSLNNPNNLPVTFESSNTNVASVDEEGVVTVKDYAGNATITATFAGNEEYYDATASFDITVNRAETGYAFSAASASVNIGEGLSLPTISATNANADLTLSFTSSNTNVATVTSTGKQTYAVTIKSVGTTTIKAAWNQTTRFEKGEISFDLNVADPNVTPTTSTYTKVTSASDIEDNGVYLLAGSFTYSGKTVLAIMSGANAKNEAFTTVNPSGSTLANSYDFDEVNAPGKPYEVTLVALSDGTYGLLLKDGSYLTNSTTYGSKYTNKLNTSSNTSDNKTHWTVSYAGGKTTITNAVQVNNANVRLMCSAGSGTGIFNAYGTSQQDITLYKRTSGGSAVEYAQFEINPLAYDETTNAYYATYYTDKKFAMPANTQAATVNVEGNVLTMNYKWTAANEAVVPANTGILIKASAPGTYVYAVSEEEATAAGDNLLKGSLSDATTVGDGCLFYGLSGGANGLGFYWGEEDGAAFTNYANRAYLAVPAPIAANLRGFGFAESGEATAINAIEKVSSNNAVRYNLAGQRVNANAKGIVIVNGKKMLNK